MVKTDGFYKQKIIKTSRQYDCVSGTWKNNYDKRGKTYISGIKAKNVLKFNRFCSILVTKLK